jgi:hypothetical protein
MAAVTVVSRLGVLRDGKTLSLSRRYKALLPPAIRERL